jgi:hypothetical protein
MARWKYVVCVALGLLAACKKEDAARSDDDAAEDDGGSKKSKKKKSAKDKSDKSEKSDGDAPKLASNPTVLEHLKKIGDGCSVRPESALVTDCKANESDALKEWVAKNKPADVYETLAGVIATGDDKAKAVAIHASGSVWFRMDLPMRKANATRPAAIGFIDALAKDDTSARFLADTAAHLGTLSGERERLLGAIASVKNKQTKSQAYRNLMTYGRLDVLPTLQAAAKEADYTVPALAAPRSMYDWTEAELAAICPWAQSYLGDARLDVAAESGLDLVRCKGAYVDALLDEGEKRLAAKQFKPPFSGVFREVCFEFMKGVTGQAGREAQCKRNYAFLEKVANDATVESSVRGLALWNIYYQRRDQETLDLMRRYEKHSDPEVAKRAKEAITSLTTTYKLK